MNEIYHDTFCHFKCILILIVCITLNSAALNRFRQSQMDRRITSFNMSSVNGFSNMFRKLLKPLIINHCLQVLVYVA